ncbi:MAG: LacI family DNA-binding transcriptional regulator, partial [Eubacteriales bacterium]|nr:LacI family DNA-binding transcriptional regulator [Eubacteriales bacterium]
MATKATIKDVARLAEVSPSTVSRALRDNPRISEEVRKRVRQIAKDLDFHPNQMARSL